MSLQFGVELYLVVSLTLFITNVIGMCIVSEFLLVYEIIQSFAVCFLWPFSFLYALFVIVYAHVKKQDIVVASAEILNKSLACRRKDD